MKRTTIVTDGACIGNPGFGGWAAILQYQGTERILRGYADKETTNNRMELTAAIEGLEALTRRCDVTLISDSQYVTNPFNKGWIHSWENNKWRKSDGGPVKNLDLFTRLYELNEKHSIEWKWVRGHSGHKDNERADAIAASEARKAKRA